jgi:hypothetical protein
MKKKNAEIISKTIKNGTGKPLKNKWDKYLS